MTIYKRTDFGFIMLRDGKQVGAGVGVCPAAWGRLSPDSLRAWRKYGVAWGR